MPSPGDTNSQATDGSVQSDIVTAASASSTSQAASMNSNAHSVGLMFYNAVADQQRQTTSRLAASSQGLANLYPLRAPLVEKELVEGRRKVEKEAERNKLDKLVRS